MRQSIPPKKEVGVELNEGEMLHCAWHADCYSWGTQLYLKKRTFAFTACKRSLGATLAAAPAAFEFLLIFFLALLACNISQ